MVRESNTRRVGDLKLITISMRSALKPDIPYFESELSLVSLVNVVNVVNVGQSAVSRPRRSRVARGAV